MKNVLFVCLLFITANSYAQKQADLKLWYNKPAGDVWENALPLGNDFLGAMVYGNVAPATIQLNEYTVWSGSPNRNDNPLALDSLAEIRKLVFERKPVGTNEGGGGTFNNLFDAHPPFQIDGNFEWTSGITEMLMQSEDKDLNLLPVLPDVWKSKGSISGFRARGGFDVVSIIWKDGQVIKSVIKSTPQSSFACTKSNEDK